MNTANETAIIQQCAATAVHTSDLSALPTLGFDDPLAILGSAPFPEVPWWKRLSPSTIFVLLSGAIAVLFLLHELTIAVRLGFPSDEAWIDQVYARNFFHHIAFEFNVDERTAGPTAPLWIVFLAVGAALFHDGILAAKLLGSIFLFLTGYYTFRLLRSTEHDYGTSLIGGVLAVTAGQLAWSELSGLESTLASALVMGGLWWHFANPHGWRRYVTGAVFALAALTRPETSLIFLLLLFYTFFERRESDHGEHWVRLREILLTASVFVLIIVPIALTNIALSGSIVPETFYSSLGRESILMLVRHGHIVDVLRRLLVGFRSIWFAIQFVYLPVNPVFGITIILALISRGFRRRVLSDRSESVFTASLLILLAFPYLRAVTLGTDDLFGEYGRWMHFLLPVYAICGVTSIRILVRQHVGRTLSCRSAIYLGALLLALCGSLIIAFGPQSASSYADIAPIFDYLLLYFFTAVLLVTAIGYNRIPFFKSIPPAIVTERERNSMSFAFDDTESDDVLPAVTVKALRAVLLITLAWNLAELPRAANDFGDNVREVNRVNLVMARTISSVTRPSDVIASDAVGAVGWASDRRVIDVQGRLTGEPSHNIRALGHDRGLLKTLADTRPAYFAMFTTEYSNFAKSATAHRFFEQVLPTAPTQIQPPVLYHINYAALPYMESQ